MNGRKGIALIVGILGVIAVSEYFSPVMFRAACSRPLAYSLGGFDGRFGISQRDFLAVMQDAELIWERQAGRELFSYDPDAKFKVNLVYDERQAKTTQHERIKTVLESSESSFKTFEEEYATLVERYDADRISYEKKAAAFERDLAAYNSEVDEWNSKGGAPEREFQALKAKQRDLDRRAAALEVERRDLNELGGRINGLADEGSRLAENYNSVVRTYNQTFGTTTEFDQGDYRGDEINIYQFRNKLDLTMVAAHELGHALGIDHVDDPKSIMYHFMGEQDLNRLALTEGDQAALRETCSL